MEYRGSGDRAVGLARANTGDGFHAPKKEKGNTKPSSARALNEKDE